MAERELERLRCGFAAFRRTHRPGTRIPHALRGAVLAALERSTGETAVRRACGVTAEQIAQWRSHPRVVTEMNDVGEKEVQVFPVIDGMAGGGPKSSAEGHEEPTLELRLGRWAIVIGQVGA